MQREGGYVPACGRQGVGMSVIDRPTGFDSFRGGLSPRFPAYKSLSKFVHPFETIYVLGAQTLGILLKTTKWGLFWNRNKQVINNLFT